MGHYGLGHVTHWWMARRFHASAARIRTHPARRTLSPFCVGAPRIPTHLIPRCKFCTPLLVVASVHWLVICRLSGLSSSPLILHPPPYNSLQIRLSHNELCHGRIERERGREGRVQQENIIYQHTGNHVFIPSAAMIALWRAEGTDRVYCWSKDWSLCMGIGGMRFFCCRA